MLSVGIPKEIKSREKRVALIPGDVQRLTKNKIPVFVQAGAGLSSGFEDALYASAGAEILPDLPSIYRQADLIQKVKEPLALEYELLRPGQFLFCFLHLASPENCNLVKVLCDKKITALAYETLEKDSKTPILAPMSEIAGALAAAYSAFFSRLSLVRDGQIIYPVGFQANLETIANLYPRVPDFLKSGNVLIYGGGVAGRRAAEFSLAMGGAVTVIEKRPETRQKLEAELKAFGPVHVLSPDADLREVLADADVLIGAVHSPGKRAHQMLSAEMLKNSSLTKKKVMIDISIDQGGNFPSALITNYDAPLRLDDFGNLRFEVPNMPSLCGYGASRAISSISMPYTQAIALSLSQAFKDYPEIQSAINVRDGQVTNPGVRDAHKL